MNEREIIDLITKSLGSLNKNFSERGNDVNWFLYEGKRIVISCDMLVQSTDLPKGFPLFLASRKSIVSCISDFAAKGVKPMLALTSIALPRGIENRDIRDIVKGYKMVEREFGIKIIGGDTNEAKEFIFDTFLLGISDKVVSRKGAREGDVIFVSDYFGYSSSGLKIMLYNLKAKDKFKEKALKAFTKPKPKLNFGILLNQRDLMSSSIDSSDGLAISLYQLAEANNVSMVLNYFPANEEIYSFAELNKIDPKELIFYGGEEYEMVATASKENFEEIRRIGKKLKVKVIPIGRVEKGEPKVFYYDGKTKFKIERRGFTHLA
ncbi:MAG: thiamine-phosphate kinase [Nitrososphaerales archaeon]